jgi:hypothetical protein
VHEVEPLEVERLVAFVSALSVLDVVFLGGSGGAANAPPPPPLLRAHGHADRSLGQPLGELPAGAAQPSVANALAAVTPVTAPVTFESICSCDDNLASLQAVAAHAHKARRTAAAPREPRRSRPPRAAPRLTRARTPALPRARARARRSLARSLDVRRFG